MKGLRAVVPAAGRGSRLRARTGGGPKGLVQVAGRPLLAHVLDRLVELDASAVSVVVSSGDEAIRRCFGAEWRGRPLRYVEQGEPLGLAHAVALGAQGCQDSFLVMHGDVVFAPGVELHPVIDRFERGDVAACLLIERREPERVGRGAVHVDDEGRVRGLMEYPGTEEQRWGRVAAGFYAFGPEIREALDSVEPSPAGELELPAAVRRLLEWGHGVAAVDLEGERVNVNTPVDLDRAERLLRT